MKIKEGTREGKLPGPIGVEFAGMTEARAVGITMPATALGSLGMFMATNNGMKSN